MNYDKIGDFISEKRKLKGLTQKELAAKIGVTDKAVSKWERGLGCPDVSILEILSKELDVSILELLKGREIEDEVIHVTELDDYVKDTINYSKQSIGNKIKKYISNILLGIVLFICLLLVFLNVVHYIYLNKDYGSYFHNGTREYAVNYLSKAEDNINIIKQNQGSFNKEDYNKIVSYLDEEYNAITNSKIFTLKDGDALKIKDIYEIYYKGPILTDMVSVYRVLATHDSSIDFVSYLYQYSTYVFMRQDYSNKIINSYQYTFFNIFWNLQDINDYNELSLEEALYSEELYTTQMAYNLLITTKDVMKAGGINE